VSDRVFIVSRAKAPLRSLKLAIRNAGMAIIGVEESNKNSLAGATQDAMRHASYVLLVWDTTLLPGSLLFEAGLATGIGANVVLLDARKRQDVRDDLAVEAYLSVPRLHGRLNDVEGLTRELNALRYVRFQSASSPDGSLTEAEWPLSASQVTGGTEFEGRVLRVLDRLHVAVLQVSAEKQRRIPDWEVMVPGLMTPFNPVFVELAARNANLEKKRDQIRRALLERGAHIGALITLDPLRSRVETIRDTAIVEIDLMRLEETPGEFDALLRTARNQLLHGAR
jgi:hypothetical protein